MEGGKTFPRILVRKKGHEGFVSQTTKANAVDQGNILLITVPQKSPERR